MADDGQENLDQPAPDYNLSADGDGAEDWVLRAWQLWLRGVREWTKLGEQVGKDRKTVKRHLEKFSHAVQEALLANGMDALAEYVGTLREALTATWALYANTDQDNVKLGCLKTVSDLAEQIAAALGVVTERKALDVKQDVSIDFGISEDGIPGQAPD
jgi:hypothetical protein